MTSILALDPAWTEREPSGVALLTNSHGQWRCAGLSPSYSQFLDLADRKLVDWTERPPGGAPDVTALIESAGRLLGGQAVDVVTVDMPIATNEIHGRREADNAVSRAYGARGCSTHSPSSTRPGALGRRLSEQCAALGFSIATTTTDVGHTPVVAEVYPHPALLSLLHEEYRVEYKVSRSASYWRDERKSPEERKHLIVDQWRRVYDEIAKSISAIDLPLPPTTTLAALSFRDLKRYEDSLDALICGWVGVKYLEGRCTAYGDETAAIWIP
jgi:predicted RNase H-like nuclease